MPGYVDSKDVILARLRLIEGQVRGVQRMVNDEKYCIDVLTQISAATSGLRRVAVVLLNDHLAHCVTEAVAGSGEVGTARVAEATAAIDRLLKS
jgi:DNA-binding FrmR family transcriptional regulator